MPSHWLWLQFDNLNRKVDLIMADLTGLQSAVSQVQTDVSEAVTALEELSAKVAAGEAQQADVDAITEQVRSMGQSLDEARESDDTGTGETP